MPSSGRTSAGGSPGAARHGDGLRPGALAGLFLLAFAVRVGFCMARGTLGQTSPDRYREYIVAGQRLLEQGTLVSPLIVADVDRAASSLLPPVYAWVVAGAYSLAGVESHAATLLLHLLNAAATALASVVAACAAGRLSGRSAAWFVGLGSAVNPTLIGFTDLIWDTSLFTLGVAATVWMSVRLREAAPAARPWFPLGAWMGLLALLNPALTVAYPFLVLWPMLRVGHKAPLAQGVRNVLLVVFGWLVVIAPWTARNYRATGELTYIRGGLWLEVWLGVCPEADTRGDLVYQNQFPLNSASVQRHVAEVGEKAFLRECRDKARAAMAADPGRFLRLCSTRVIDYWAGTLLSHSSGGTAGGGNLARAAVTWFLIAESAALLLLLAWSWNRVPADAYWLLGMLLVFSAVYCLTHVQVRFRAPAEPLVAILLAVLAFSRRSTTIRPHAPA